MNYRVRNRIPQLGINLGELLLETLLPAWDQFAGVLGQRPECCRSCQQCPALVQNLTGNVRLRWRWFYRWWFGGFQCLLYGGCWGKLWLWFRHHRKLPLGILRWNWRWKF
jgi:hypothetical protein